MRLAYSNQYVQVIHKWTKANRFNTIEPYRCERKQTQNNIIIIMLHYYTATTGVVYLLLLLLGMIILLHVMVIIFWFVVLLACSRYDWLASLDLWCGRDDAIAVYALRVKAIHLMCGRALAPRLDFLQEIRFRCLYKHFSYGVMLWWATRFGVLYGYTVKFLFFFLRFISVGFGAMIWPYRIFLWLI